MVQAKESIVVRFFNMVVSTSSQIFLFFMTAGIALLIVHSYNQTFKTLEPFPELLPITAKKITEWHGDPTLVKVGLHINNFPVFDITNNQFTFEGVIWFEFDKALASLETIDKFTFEKGEILNKSKPEIKAIGEKVLAQYDIRVKFSTNLSYDLFPLDEHLICISLENNFVSPGELIFEAYKPGFTLSKELYIPEWQVERMHVESGYTEAQLDPYDSKKVQRNPKVVFALDMKRLGYRQGLLILLPLYLILFLSLFSLGLEPKAWSSYIIAMTSACITSLIGYRFVIQSMSPTVGYFVFSDQIFILFLAFSFVEFLLGLVLVVQKKLTSRLIIIRGAVFLSFHILFLIEWYYLLLYWKG